MEKIRLTQFSKGSGCGCKIAPAKLKEILDCSAGAQIINPLLLVGNGTNDDAAVLDIGNGQLLISTTDFFTPIVDDAYDFGAIAAANAISDVYAMGGKPVLAIAVFGWPVEKLSAELAAQVLDGAKATCAKAGITLAGGHSIDSPEPFFGLSVNGITSQSNLKKNIGAQTGDKIYITKPIGTGILATAQKREKLAEEDAIRLLENLKQLNSIGAELGQHSFVHAMTDITGFGIIGHLIEMAEGSQLSARVDYSKVPLIEGLQAYTQQYIYPDNTMRNWSAYQGKVQGIVGESLLTLCDPQTNGGLMVAVDSEQCEAFETLMQKHNHFYAEIGAFVPKQVAVIEVF